MIIDGQKIAATITEEIRLEVESMQGRKPCLRVILVGSHPASLIYIKRKIEAAKKAGIDSEVIKLDESISQEELFKTIDYLNKDSSVDGILVQLPLPSQIDSTLIINAVDPTKDVDGFHPLNQGKLMAADPSGFVPCTPLGIQKMLLASHIDPSGKEVVIVGRGAIVGKPLAALLMQNLPGANATVTVAHSKSHNLKELCLRADILIAAIGSAHHIKADMVKPGAIVIDVGINADSGKLKGDVDFENVQHVASLISPVPGGVGPMTIASLLLNTLKARKLHV